MQITDEHGWVQWALGGISALGLTVTAYFARAISGLRRFGEENQAKIAENTLAIAVNTALREESARRHTEIVVKLEAMEKESRDELGKLHSRINDVLSIVRDGRGQTK